ncbi:hypothetical protein OQX63_14665 [Pedobacter sp. PF22-3]|uniref:tetratricopeptide repeat protein n=1 Tax=Pedobacter sp. PF22-3 TaxID=2994467 RepID=UPI002244FF5B|nr:hypothetical protein [Pedobacter sp. PF22-3]MCX2494727.1 hypothetical protein [Pedobacter sp. PF22-3]
MFWNKFLEVSDPIKKWTSFVQLFIALGAALFTISNFFGSFVLTFIPSEYIPFTRGFILYLCILFLVFRVTGLVLHEKTNGDNRRERSSYKYSKSLRRLAKMIRAISLLGILVAMYFFFQLHSRISKSCQEDEKKLAIMVAKFSDKQDLGFVGQMMNDLHSKISDTSVVIDKLDKHLAAISESELKDSIITFSKCYKKSMLIFGSRDISDGVFFCNIYLHNIMNNCSSFKSGDTLIRVEDPKIIEFKTALKQVDVVSDLVKSLLYSSRCEHQAAIKIINIIRTKNLTINNSKILAYCNLLKGNSFVRLGQIDSARKSYLEGLKSQPQNSLIITNLSRISKIKVQTQDNERVKNSPELSKKEIGTLLQPIKSPSQETVQFKKAVMSFTFPMDKVFKDNVDFERTFSVGEDAYIFKGGEKIDSIKMKDGNFVYFYTLLPNPSMNYIKMDLKSCRNGIFSFLVTDKFAKVDVTKMRATLTFIFPDKSKYRLKPYQVKFLK